MSGCIRVARVNTGPLWSIGSTYYSPALLEHAKAVPGMTFDRPTRTWQGYADAVTAVVARLFSKGIHCDHADDLPAADSWRTARSPFLFSTQNLRDYQVDGVRFLIARSRDGALLADGMRLGKSLQSIVAARAFKQKTLVICPSHVVGVWGRSPSAPEGPGEIAKWWPDAWKEPGGVVCLESVKPSKPQAVLQELGSKKEEALTPKERDTLAVAQGELAAFAETLKNAQVIVCHYDIIYAWVHVLLLWGMETLILDEAHILSGYQSRRSHSLKVLAAAARSRIALSGTPVTNLPRHLHNVLEILCPGRFGFFFIPPPLDPDKKFFASYARLFCDSQQITVGSGPEQKVVWQHIGRSNLDLPDGKTAIVREETLHSRLKFLMLRRLKKDVDPQLPQKTRQIVDVSIPARCVIGVSSSMLGTGGGELRRCLDLAADGKLKSVVNLVAGHAAEDEKVICFCYRRLFAEAVARDLKKRVSDNALIVFVHGGLPQRERDRRIHRLRTHDGPGVLACTIDTTSTGIDLSFAAVAVFGELTYEPHEYVQAEERLYKFSVDAKAFIQYVIARGTGDELILRAVIAKLDTFERVIGETGDNMRADLSHKKEGGMARLYAALAEMQQTPVTGPVKRPKKGRS